MTGSQIINFNNKVGGYVNDNAEFIAQTLTANPEMSIAQAALFHYQEATKAYEETPLNDQEQAQFLANVNYAQTSKYGFFLSEGTIEPQLIVSFLVEGAEQLQSFSTYALAEDCWRKVSETGAPASAYKTVGDHIYDMFTGDIVKP